MRSQRFGIDGWLLWSAAVILPINVLHKLTENKEQTKPVWKACHMSLI